MNTQTFADRLKMLIGKGSATSFAEKCGIGASSIRQYLSGTVPGLDKVIAIAEAANVSVEWLATGKESATHSNEKVAKSTDYIGVPRYDTRLSAGGGAWNSEQERPLDHIPFTRDFFAKRLNKSKTSDLIILTIDGDSMEPLINGDDLVMVDQAQKRVTDGIFAFVLEDLARVKRLRKLANGDLEIRSDNPLYPPEVLKKEQLNDLNIIGKVVWCGHHFAR